MSSNCNEFNELLLDLAYDELDTQTASRLLLHKDECTACSKAYNDVIGVRAVTRQMVSPPIPDNFDNAILTLARKTADSFVADREGSVIAPTTSPVNKSPSLLHRIQSFILRPPVIGTGLAAAALLIAVTSIKTQSHTTMLTAPDGAPFEGAAPAMEQEKLPATGTTDSKTTTGTMQKSADNVDTALPVDNDESVPTPQRVQKAGGGYEPLYRENRVESKSRRKMSKAPGETLENADKDDSALSEKVKKNPADLLQQKPVGDGLASNKRKSDAYTTPVAPTPKTASTRRSRKKSASYPIAGNAAPQSPPQASQKSPGDADGELAADLDAAAESEERITSNFQSGLDAYNRGDCKSAIAYFNTYIDSPADPSGSIAVATHYIARCEKRTGRCGKALIHYEQLLSEYTTYSKRSDALYEAAQCHIKLGHPDRARVLLNELSLDPDWRTRARKLLKE